MDVQETIGRLRANAELIRTLAQSVSDEQANWNPDAQTWSLRETMEHVCNEKRIDFRAVRGRMVRAGFFICGGSRRQDDARL